VPDHLPARAGNRKAAPEQLEITAWGLNIMEKKMGHSSVIDISGLVDSCKEKWMNYSLTEVNDSVVRLGILEGEFHWHKHDLEDEFFFVVSGKLLLDLEHKTLELLPNQGYTVPRQVMHRTRANEKTIVLMVEGNTVNPKFSAFRSGRA
jgi:mannose-6-phosphate isomerase-like protein (cupin superfamily)